MTVMLYKSPGKYKIHGGNFDYTIVDDDKVDAALKDGWFKTTEEAAAPKKKAKVKKQAHNDND